MYKYTYIFNFEQPVNTVLNHGHARKAKPTFLFERKTENTFGTDFLSGIFEGNLEYRRVL